MRQGQQQVVCGHTVPDLHGARKIGSTGAQGVKQWHIVPNSVFAGRFSDSRFDH